MERVPVRIVAPAGVEAARHLEDSPYWAMTTGPADWELILSQTAHTVGWELRHAPSGTTLHRAIRKEPQDWAPLLHRFGATRLIRATVLIITTRDYFQINRGWIDFVEAGMEFHIIRKDVRVARLRVVNAQQGDSLLSIIDRGRGIKPEDSALGLWVP
jgi:hypothetical protein